MRKIDFLFVVFLCLSIIRCTSDKDSDEFFNPLSNPEDGPAAGYSDGNYTVPDEATPEDISNPDYIIGTGTPESCTCEEVVHAISLGGTIVFNGGDEPFTIDMTETARVFNNASEEVVIDGGGLVNLSGMGERRILYMNTCDPNLVWTTSHCQNQEYPKLTLQNITFSDGNSISETEYDGGGAVWVRGGRLKIVNCRFFNNRCIDEGPDVGGGALRVLSQYENKPVYVVNTTFGGDEGYGNIGSNGGATSSIGVSWTFINCLFSHNQAIGNGGNPAQSGTPGGGSGGAIYNDGNTMTLKILGCKISQNEVNAYGSGVFFVTNNHTGNIVIEDSYIKENIGGSWYPVYPQISMHSDTEIEVKNSIIEE